MLAILLTVYFLLNLFMLFINEVAVIGIRTLRKMDSESLTLLGHSPEEIEDIREEQRGEKIWAKVTLLFFGTIIFLLGLCSLVYEKVTK